MEMEAVITQGREFIRVHQVGEILRFIGKQLRQSLRKGIRGTILPSAYHWTLFTVYHERMPTIWRI